MINLIIRRARDEDWPELASIFHILDPGDYALKTWPLWMAETKTVNLVAELDGRVVGCTYGETLSFPDGWSQVTRVHPDMQRRGIGLKLMARLEMELADMGATAMFGNIGAYNKPSFAFFSVQGWKVVFPVKRRRIACREGIDRSSVPENRREIADLVDRMPVLASIRRVAYFQRAYFSMNDYHLERAISARAVRLAPDGDAYALIDADAAIPYETIWVSALAGSHGGMLRLLNDIMAEAGSRGAELVVDAADDPELQASMDSMGFTPPGKKDIYSVVRKDLTADQQVV